MRRHGGSCSSGRLAISGSAASRAGWSEGHVTRMWSALWLATPQCGQAAEGAWPNLKRSSADHRPHTPMLRSCFSPSVSRSGLLFDHTARSMFHRPATSDLCIPSAVARAETAMGRCLSFLRTKLGFLFIRTHRFLKIFYFIISIASNENRI